MLFGYARASVDGDPDEQIDALRRAGVEQEKIYLDRTDGAKASRPQLDLVINELRGGDTLVITELNRIGRSVSHLIALGDQFRERGVGLRVLEQDIDTATVQGRAMVTMLSVLAEFQRELTAANAREGRAAARARGRTGGRPPKLTTDQVALAQRLYDAGEHTVAQIADRLGVRRTTLYGHLSKTAATPTPATGPGPATTPEDGAAHPELPGPVRKSPRACPTCGHEPTTRGEAIHQRADLAVTWLHPRPDDPGAIVARHHCRQCQPDARASDIGCTVCGDGPILAGELTATTAPVQRWLTAAGWRTTPHLLCPDHT